MVSIDSTLSADDLAAATGGGSAGAPCEKVYGAVSAYIRGTIAGGMLAKTMYGPDATPPEKANGRQVLKSYLRGEHDPPR